MISWIRKYKTEMLYAFLFLFIVLQALVFGKGKLKEAFAFLEGKKGELEKERKELEQKLAEKRLEKKAIEAEKKKNDDIFSDAVRDERSKWIGREKEINQKFEDIIEKVANGNIKEAAGMLGQNEKEII